MDNILKSLNELHDKWDSKGGLSGDDKYDDALYYCINDLADLIVKYEIRRQRNGATQREV